MNVPLKVQDRDTPAVKVGGRREVRLPAETMRALRIRKGTMLDVHVSGGVVMLVPVGRISKGQRYFWTEEWQKKEREADEAIARGDVLGPFDHADAAIQALRNARV
jgi:antitoxin MazE